MCSMYVDDFLVCVRGKNMRTIERQLQLCLNDLSTWSTRDGFKFSETKSVAMHFCRLRRLHHEPELRLNGQPIRVVTETKFLGLTFDNKLSFHPHIKELKERGLKALNLIKVLSSTQWGSDQTTLLRLYRALVRSKLDYGCQVYGSAPKSYIKKLDTIHHQGLRLALGAFKTSPVVSLYVEAKEPSLQHRRLKLSLQYALRLRSSPDNPAHADVFTVNNRELYDQKEKAIKPFCLRVETHLENLNVQVDCIDKHSTLFKVPPWELRKPDLIFDMCKTKKAETHPLQYQEQYQNVRFRYLTQI